MTTDTQTSDVLGPNPEPVKRTQTLNVLTILTFIGCAIGLYFGIQGYRNAAENYQKIQDAQDKIAQAPSWAQSLAGPDVMEAARRSLEYRLPILIIYLVSVGLCGWGAYRMRMLVKTGFYFYVIGELFPLLANFFVPPGGTLAIVVLVVGLIIAGVFIGLYAGQVKHMQ